MIGKPEVLIKEDGKHRREGIGHFRNKDALGREKRIHFAEDGAYRGGALRHLRYREHAGKKHMVELVALAELEAVDRAGIGGRRIRIVRGNHVKVFLLERNDVARVGRVLVGIDHELHGALFHPHKLGFVVVHVVARRPVRVVAQDVARDLGQLVSLEVPAASTGNEAGKHDADCGYDDIKAEDGKNGIVSRDPGRDQRNREVGNAARTIVDARGFPLGRRKLRGQKREAQLQDAARRKESEDEGENRDKE